MWNGLFFQRSSLKDLGLRVQLGHPPGRFCPTKEPGHKHFTVINSNAIHSIAVDFCRCTPVPHQIQLLRMGWWPATPLEPQTCATMSVLCHFHLLNLQGKVTGYSFYRTLEYQTDNTGLNVPSVSFKLSFYLFSSLLWLLGPSPHFHVDGQGMVPYQDGQACRKSF